MMTTRDEMAQQYIAAFIAEQQYYETAPKKFKPGEGVTEPMSDW